MAAKLNILVIEDNANCAELVRYKLAKKFTLTFVSTLKEGLKLLNELAFEVVLLDLNLVNGRKETVLDEVRGKHDGAVVVLTGDANPRTRDQMLLQNADGFAVKGKDDKEEGDLEWIIFRALENRKKKK